ncbi:signal transduction histidine kinase [Catalinimonas alkaloidigena]|uniref:sensor histidine kinase n=1 Tax=Catalinimonas alkaloidigena TaxID=1075417 RepID=UPI002406A132|nr:HAMP domain-containing sensor histidine kinase [Catalinimonas alkaloidigena]MDF9796309.1 signal transduction histidine kinase [Catalinimonas alkaloidigena]
MDAILHDGINVILSRPDTSILSGIHETIFYQVGSKVQRVKFNHHDNKVIVSHDKHQGVVEVLTVSAKPYLILCPIGRHFFRILKLSIENNQLIFGQIKHPHDNHVEREIETIIVDNDKKEKGKKKITFFTQKKSVSGAKSISGDETEALLMMNRELLERNEILERVNSDLSNFVYTSSHDLIAPLSRIEGLIELLGDEILTKDSESYLQLIKISILKFKEAVQELADSEKVESDLITQTNSIDINELLEDVILSLQDEILSSHASIVTHFREKEILFSKKNLRSLVYNLVSNAIKYRSSERNPIITISTHTVPGFLTLIVSDNGMGIKADQLDSIFTLYYRLGQQVDGQGIGLYLVNNIMEAAGGKIEVESEYGIGSKFSLCFKQ